MALALISLQLEVSCQLTQQKKTLYFAGKTALSSVKFCYSVVVLSRCAFFMHGCVFD